VNPTSQGPGAKVATEAAQPYKERLKHLAHAALEPLTAALARLGVGPDGVTIMGLMVSLVAALAFFEGYFRFGAVMVAGPFRMVRGFSMIVAGSWT